MALKHSAAMDRDAFFRTSETFLVLTHSYGIGLLEQGFTKFSMNGRAVDVRYLTVPSATYETFTGEVRYWQEIKNHKPDYVLVLLGGNVVGSSRTREQMRSQATEFYRTLRFLLPRTTIISAQVEMRWYKEDNFYGAPTEVQYRRDRNMLNNHIARQIPDKDYVLSIAGEGRLDNRDFYCKGDQGYIHMTPEGYELYTREIVKVINYIHMQIKERYERIAQEEEERENRRREREMERENRRRAREMEALARLDHKYRDMRRRDRHHPY